MKLWSKLLLAGGVVLAVNGLDNRLEVTHYAPEFAELPENFDGYTIAQISDYHCDSIPGIESEIKNEAPDIIVCTGDMADDKGSYMPAIRLLERIREIAPVYMVTGNHDLWRTDYTEFLNACEKVGAKYLHNERVILERGNECISLSGIDDPFICDRDKISQALDKSISELGKFDGFEILLFHRANMLDNFRARGYDLILSGHMHGGQIRMPFTKNGVCAPTSSIRMGGQAFFPQYCGGYYTLGKTQMIVNRGLGNPMVIPRLFNRPEITIVKLKRADMPERTPTKKTAYVYKNTENVFYQNYKSMSTSHLMEMYKSDDYTDAVKSLIKEILSQRGVNI